MGSKVNRYSSLYAEARRLPAAIIAGAFALILACVAAPALFASGEADTEGTGVNGTTTSGAAAGQAVARGINAPATVSLRLDDVKAVDALLDGYWEDSLQVAFGTFTYEYTGLSSPFSRYLEEALTAMIAKSEKLRLFNRNVAAAMEPALRETYQEFFETNQVGGLLAGRFFDEGDRVRVRLELTKLGDGNLVGTGDLSRPKADLPPRLALEPGKETEAAASAVVKLLDNAAPVAAAPAVVVPAAPVPAATIPTAAAPAAKLASSSPAATAQTLVKWSYQTHIDGLAVAVSTERGPGASYSDGENMVCLVSVNKEAYVKIYHIDVYGQVQLIWPNRYGGGGTLKPGAPVRVPGQNDGFAFTLGPPYGTEFIKVVASTVPFDNTEADFLTLSGDARTAIDRGLTVTATPSAASGAGVAAERAEALASYYIGPKGTTVFNVE